MGFQVFTSRDRYTGYTNSQCNVIQTADGARHTVASSTTHFSIAEASVGPAEGTSIILSLCRALNIYSLLAILRAFCVGVGDWLSATHTLPFKLLAVVQLLVHAA